MSEEILAKAEQLKRDLDIAMKDLRETKMYVSNIEENKDSMEIALTGAGKTIYLNSVMSTKAMEEIKQVVFYEINKSIRNKERTLGELIGLKAHELAQNQGKSEIGEQNSSKIIENEENNARQQQIKENQDSDNEKSDSDNEKKEPENKNETKKAKKEPQKSKKPSKVANKAAVKVSKSGMTDEDEKALLEKLYLQQGMSVKEIAQKMKLTDQNVRDRIKKYGLRDKKTITISKDKAIAMLMIGKSVQEIADDYKITKKECYTQLEALNIDPKDYVKKTPN